MKLIATLYDAKDMEWKVKVDPKGVRGQERFEDQTVIRFWVPDGKAEDKMLIYNPKIALQGRIQRRSAIQGDEYILIPIHLLYAFANRLSMVYQGLTSSGLSKKDGSQIYLDQNKVLASSRKIAIYNKSLNIIPSVVSGYNGEDMLGVQFTVDGRYAGQMLHTEVREFCEILNHTDVQMFALQLATLEKLENMDTKLDTVIAQNNQLQIMLNNMANMLKSTHNHGNASSLPDSPMLSWKPAN